MSPSSFARRIACSGSFHAEAGLPDTSSSYARKGSAAHAVAETCLRGGHAAEEMIGRIFEGVICDAEMAEAVQVYLNYVWHLQATRSLGPNDIGIEAKLDLGFLGEGEKGTADFVCIGTPAGEDLRILEAVDYKHGSGVPVDAERNAQIICYGLGAAAMWSDRAWQVLRVTVVQPRAPHPGGSIRSYDVSRSEVGEYLLEYSDVAERARDLNAPRVAGPHCRFCKANAVCETLAKYAEKAAEETFAVAGYDGRKLADALAKIPLVKMWINAVEDRAMAEANAGRIPPGWKLVATRAARRWIDEANALKRLQKYGLDDKDLYASSFKSPAQVEKIVGKKQFAAELEEDLVEKRSSGVTLAPENDPRPTAKMSAEETFESVS